MLLDALNVAISSTVDLRPSPHADGILAGHSYKIDYSDGIYEAAEKGLLPAVQESRSDRSSLEATGLVR
jgi:hypothetical protein